MDRTMENPTQRIMLAGLCAAVLLAVISAIRMQYGDSVSMNHDSSDYGAAPANDNVSQEEIQQGDPEYGRCPEGGYHFPNVVTYGFVEITKCLKCERLLKPLF